MRLGIDLGGTKIASVVMDSNGLILSQERRPTPAVYSDILRAVQSIVGVAESQFGNIESIGVGCPGAQSKVTGGMKNSNTECLNGRDFKSDLAIALGREVHLANDADCFTLSEAIDGSAAGLGCVFGVILGTGAGGGISVAGKLLSGPNAIAGEWGHNPMPGGDEGRECYCGRRDCIETYLSGAGLSESYRLQSVQSLPAHEIAALAEAGEVMASQVLEKYCQQLARALAGVINILDPHAIVLGGGLSQISM
ncbi:MAG: ROK family protein, partial [Spongiibacteraceae bacterium]